MLLLFVSTCVQLLHVVMVAESRAINEAGLDTKSNPLKLQVPQFMMDLYNVVADENGYSRNGAPDIGKNINCVSAQASRYVNESREFFYRFNLTSIENDLAIKRVELRIFKTKSRRRENVFYRTDLVLDGDSYRDMRSIMVSSTGYGWLSFDVTNIARHLIKLKDDVIDVTITLRPIRNQLPSFRLLTSTKTTTRALFIVYSDGPSKLSQRTTGQYASMPYDTVKSSYRQRRSAKKTRHSCRLLNLTISFHEHVEFSEIILPSKANIHRCGGSCRLPSGFDSSAEETYHATMQNMLRRSGKRVKYACCAPWELRSLLLLKKSSFSDNIKMITLDDAIVASCRCV